MGSFGNLVLLVWDCNSQFVDYLLDIIADARHKPINLYLRMHIFDFYSSYPQDLCRDHNDVFTFKRLRGGLFGLFSIVEFN